MFQILILEPLYYFLSVFQFTWYLSHKTPVKQDVTGVRFEHYKPNPGHKEGITGPVVNNPFNKLQMVKPKSRPNLTETWPGES